MAISFIADLAHLAGAAELFVVCMIQALTLSQGRKAISSREEGTQEEM